MKNFADRLILAIEAKGNPCIVGLDPRLDMMPDFVMSQRDAPSQAQAIRATITSFNRAIMEAVGPFVPAVKLQLAFYEQYGIPGLQAFEESIRIARDFNLIVIADAKRNDISSTAEAYANAFLGRSRIFGSDVPIFDIDCITISPFLGSDSLKPFLDACSNYGKGVFILVKTSNPGSVDLQDQILAETREPLYKSLGKIVNESGREHIGESGYSSVGAVVGATFPHEAVELRKIMPRAIFLVPGYGSQGGTAHDVAPCFNADGHGAVVSASRSITYAHDTSDVSREGFIDIVRSSIKKMITDVTLVLKAGKVD